MSNKVLIDSFDKLVKAEKLDVEKLRKVQIIELFCGGRWKVGHLEDQMAELRKERDKAQEETVQVKKQLVAFLGVSVKEHWPEAVNDYNQDVHWSKVELNKLMGLLFAKFVSVAQGG